MIKNYYFLTFLFFFLLFFQLFAIFYHSERYKTNEKNFLTQINFQGLEGNMLKFFCSYIVFFENK